MFFTTTALLADYESGNCSGSIKVTFSNAEFVTGLGWRTGTSRTINYSGYCNGCFWGPGIYGLMKNPLIEYYIGKSGGSSKGTYSCNGRSYTIEIYRQIGKPSIVGTADFDQYNCRGSRDSPVDMGCHFDAWRNLGVAVGTHDYQVVMAEGFGGSSGNASISVSDSNWYTNWTNGGSVDFECTGSGTNPPPSPTPTPTGPTPVPTPVSTEIPVDCSNAPEWDSSAVYENAGMRVVYNSNLYENNWYSSGQNPADNSGEYDVWTLIGPCDSDITPTPTPVPTETPEPTATPTPTPTPIETTTPTITPSTVTLGDVNSDGQVNIVDALIIAQYYVGLDPSPFNPDAADTNCDDAINIVDALLVAQYYVGLVSGFCLN